MNFLKRAGWSLWRHKFKNVLLVVVFSLIFAVTLVSFMVYSATSHQVEVTQKAVANAVTLQTPIINGYGYSEVNNMRTIDATFFVNSEYVERYNIVATDIDMDVREALPMLRTPEEQDLYREYQEILELPVDFSAMRNWQYEAWDKTSYYRAHPKEENPGYVYEEDTDDATFSYWIHAYHPDYTAEENEAFEKVYNAAYFHNIGGKFKPVGFRVTAISDSEYFDNFSSGGYSLVEGSHFKSEEEDRDYVLISKDVAELNGLHVGDTLKLQFGMSPRIEAHFANFHPWELTVRGIFEPPDTEFNGKGFSASNFVYVPYQAMINHLMDLYNNDALLWFPPTNRATAYMKNPEDVDAFVKEAYNRFNIVEFTDQNSPPSGTNIEELLDEGTFDTGDVEKINQRFSQYMAGLLGLHPFFCLMVDRGWYDMVAAPLENISTLTLMMGVGLLVGAFVVLLLICVLNIRKRKKEFGILLAMGERRGRLFLQVFAEQVVPLLLAVVIGFAVGVPFATVFGNDLLVGKSSEVNAAYDNDKRAYLDEQLKGNELDVQDSQMIRSSANVVAQSKMQFQLDQRLALLYFASSFLILFVTVLVQMVFLLRLAPARIMSRRN